MYGELSARSRLMVYWLPIEQLFSKPLYELNQTTHDSRCATHYIGALLAWLIEEPLVLVRIFAACAYANRIVGVDSC